MSWGVSPWVYTLWGSLGFLDLGSYFLSHFRKVLSHYLLKYFLFPFFLSSSSGTPMIWMLGHLTLSQRSLRLSSFLVVLFSSLLHWFPSFYLPPHLSYLLPQLFWFCPESFWSQLLPYSLLINSSLFLLGPCETFLASSQSLSLVYLSVMPFCF